MENRNGLCVLFEVRSAVGAPEAEVAVDQLVELQNRGFRPRSVGGDKGYHTSGFIEGARDLGRRRMPRVRKCVNALRKSLAGSKPPVAFARAATAESNELTLPLSTWSVHSIYSEWRNLC